MGIVVVVIGLFVSPALFQVALKYRFEPVPLPASYPHAANQAEADRQDLDYLEQLMHLDRSFSPAARERFEQERTALMQRKTPLTKPQFQLAIDHLVALANNGHTSTLASQRAGRFARAQVRFAWFGDDLYIVRTKSDFRNLLGSRVLMIDRRDIARAIAAARPYVRGVDRYAKWYSLPLLETPELLHAIWPDANPEGLTLRVLTLDRKQTETRVTVDAPHENRNKLVPIRDIAPAQIPDDTTGWQTLLSDKKSYFDSFRTTHNLESLHARPWPIEKFAQFGKRAHFVAFDRADQVSFAETHFLSPAARFDGMNQNPGNVRQPDGPAFHERYASIKQAHSEVKLGTVRFALLQRD